MKNYWHKDHKDTHEITQSNSQKMEEKKQKEHNKCK